MAAAASDACLGGSTLDGGAVDGASAAAASDLEERVAEVLKLESGACFDDAEVIPELLTLKPNYLSLNPQPSTQKPKPQTINHKP